MPKIAPELPALAVGRLKAPGRYAVGGVPGLLLQIKPSGTRSWILRISVAGKRRNYGLGGFPAVSLADAKNRAREHLNRVFAGVDPTEEKKAARIAKREAVNRSVSFEKVASKFLKFHTPTLSNTKAAAQWQSTLLTYAYPVLGSMPVSEITTQDVLRVLEPIWAFKTETASRLRGRIERVLSSAIAQGFRDHPNPARWTGNLDQVLPAPSKVAKVSHHPAAPVDDAPILFKRISKADGIAARALEFAILTASRSGEVRGAVWGEFDLANRTWAIPAERMKMKVQHRVPLSDQAIKLLKAIGMGKDDELVFQGNKGMLSDMSLTAVLRRMEVEWVPHGFRSTFKNWATERQEVPWEVSEMALSHKVGNKTESAYWRGDLYDKRKSLMQAWANFLGKQMSNQKPNKRSLSERNVASACRAGWARMEFIDSAYEFLPESARPGHMDVSVIKNFAKTARALHEASSKLNTPTAHQELEVVAALIQSEALLKHRIKLNKIDIRHRLTELMEFTQIIGDAIAFTQKPGPKTDEWLNRLVSFILDEWVKMGLPEPQGDKRSQSVIMICDYLNDKNLSKGVTEVTIANAISHWKQVWMNSESE